MSAEQPCVLRWGLCLPVLIVSRGCSAASSAAGALCLLLEEAHHCVLPEFSTMSLVRPSHSLCCQGDESLSLFDDVVHFRNQCTHTHTHTCTHYLQHLSNKNTNIHICLLIYYSGTHTHTHAHMSINKHPKVHLCILIYFSAIRTDRHARTSINIIIHKFLHRQTQKQTHA